MRVDDFAFGAGVMGGAGGCSRLQAWKWAAGLIGAGVGGEGRRMRWEGAGMTDDG